jgi:glycosyltransferase involved in cell wall biosynthesis
MSRPPVVSIITPSFNRADIVHETAASIFGQTYPHWEWVIVDDGSTDNSWEVISVFASQDQRVKVLKRDREPKGAAICRNIAVEKSTGDYVLFLDTDDLLASFCLEQRVAAMQENPGVDFIIFPMLLFKQRPDDMRLLWNIDKDIDDIDRILWGDAICQGTGTLWKKSSFVDIGMWDASLLLWQDVELHLRSLLKPLRYAKRMDLRPDIFLRESDVSLSRTGFHSYPKFRSRLKVLTQTLQQSADRGVLEKHFSGLRKMFLDILSNAARAGYAAEIRELLAMNRRYGFMDSGLERKINLYSWLRKTRLDKLPVLSGISRRSLEWPVKGPVSTLGQVPYSDPITI